MQLLDPNEYSDHYFEAFLLKFGKADNSVTMQKWELFNFIKMISGFHALEEEEYLEL